MSAARGGTRLAHDILTGSMLAVIAETLAVAHRAGIGPESFYRVVRVSRGNSGLFASRVPRILARDFSPLRTIDDMSASLEHADAAGAALHLPLATTVASKMLYRTAAALGLGGEDIAAVVKVVERLARVTLQGKAVDPTLPSRPAPPMHPPRVGFVGVGRMGSGMAANLLRAGVPLVVHDVSESAVAPLVATGARRAASFADLAACEVVFLSLPDQTVVENVVLGSDGLLGHMKPGSTLIDTSTSLPAVTRRIVMAARPAQVRIIDAPVSGGPEGAEAGTLTIIVGAEPAHLPAVLPLLYVLGPRVFHMGPPGTGHTMKVLHSALNAVTLAAMAEAIVLAETRGASPATITAAVHDSEADSGMFRSRAPRMFDRAFDPGFTVDLMHKDVHLAIRVADEFHLPTPMSSAARQSLQTVRARGAGDRDIAAVIIPLRELVEAAAGGAARE